MTSSTRVGASILVLATMGSLVIGSMSLMALVSVLLVVTIIVSRIMAPTFRLLVTRALEPTLRALKLTLRARKPTWRALKLIFGEA